MIIHIIVSFDQNISLIFMWKMDPMSSGFDIRLVFTLPLRDSTLQYKRYVHLWNNFPCIITLDQNLNKYDIEVVYIKNWYIIYHWFLSYNCFVSNLKYCLNIFKCYFPVPKFSCFLFSKNLNSRFDLWNLEFLF